MASEKIRTATAEFTRPADTTAYAVGDAVSNSTSAPTVLTFAGAAAFPGSSLYVSCAVASKSAAAVTSASFRLHLYRTSVTPTNDNAQLSLLYADRDNYLGNIPLTFKSTGTGCAFAVAPPSDTNGSLWMELPGHSGNAAATGANLYGLLEATAAYTPASAETFSIKIITVVQV